MLNTNQGHLGELAKLFLKLGAIGFGGPAAHIAMMEDEVVKKRQWLTREHFLDLIGATNLIPGPNSTEMAIHVGYIYKGLPGLVVSGICFILPAVSITAILAWVYVSFGTLPQVAPLLYGIKPAVLAIILGALWRLGKKAVKNWKLLIIALGVAISLLLGLNQVVALLLGGVLGMIGLRLAAGDNHQNTAMVALGLTSSAALSEVTAISVAVRSTTQVPLWQLGLFFLKVGSVLFGSGYVLVAFLENGLVRDYGWLTMPQLLDAIAIGQFTPGPVLSTSTFIGYLIAGLPGAAVATIGIFLPSFFFVAALNPLIPRLRASKWTSAFLDAVNAGAVALMAVVTMQLARGTLIDIATILIAIAAAIGVIRFQVNAAWLVLGGAVLGFLVSLSGWGA